MKVGWIGLGAMGAPMAGNLRRAGYEVLVWNRTASKAQDHARAYGTRAVQRPEALAEAEVIFSCLPTSAEVAEMVERLRAHLRPGTTWVDCTSGDPGASRAIASRLRESGVGFLDAPVSGGTAGAEAGTLTFMVGGEEADLEHLRPLFEAMGRTIVHLGPVGAGHATKAVNNTLLATNLLAAAEGLLALARLGVAPERALAVINQSSGRSFATEVLFPERVLDRSFPLTFKLGLLAKDVRIGTRVVEDAGVPSPVVHLVRELLQAAARHVGEEADHTEVVKLVEDWAGSTIGGEDAETAQTHARPTQ